MLIVLKMALASGLAWEIAKLAGSKHPFLAPVSVVLCMQSSLSKSLQFSYWRVLGTVFGVIVTAWAARYFPMNGWTLGLIIVLAGALSLAFSRNETLIREVALSVALVLSLQKQSGVYASDRIRDTFIGVVVALAVHYLVFRPKADGDQS